MNKRKITFSKQNIFLGRDWDDQAVARRLPHTQFNGRIKGSKATPALFKSILFMLPTFIFVGAAISSAAEPSMGEIPMLEQVVVTATKTEEKRKDVVNPVVLKDAMDIENSPARTLGDLLGGELGIDWRTRGNYGAAAEEIHIRGMEGDETQVYVNGISVNSPSLGSADTGKIQLNSIENLEVVKGSGSLLYGSGAMAGTVNLITKRPERGQTVLKAQGGYGTEDTYELALENGLYVWKDFGYFLAANLRGTDGLRDNGDLDYQDASLKLVYDPGNLDISLYGQYLNRDFGVPGVKPPAGTEEHSVNGIPFYNGDSASLIGEGSDEDFISSLQVESGLTEWLRIFLQADYSDTEKYHLTRYNADGRSTLAGEGFKSWIKNEVKGVEGNFEIMPFENAKLLLGADYSHHDWSTKKIDVDVNGNEKTGAETNDASLHTRGLYVEAQYRPSAYLKGVIGVRQEKHSTFGTEYLPLYGLILNLSAETAIKVSSGKHFKAPTPNDLFWPEDNFVRGNPDLKPQTGWHSDVTIEQTLWSDKLFVEFSYFNWDVDDKIDWAENPDFPGPWGNKWTPTNLNSSKGEGFEVGMQVYPVPQLLVQIDYTYTDAEDETAEVTRNAQYIATHNVKGTFAYSWSTNTSATAIIHYVGERDFYRSASDQTPSDELDGYFLADLLVRQVLSDHWEASLAANNVFDEDYETYIGSFTDKDGNRIYSGYPGAGRSFFAKLTYIF